MTKLLLFNFPLSPNEEDIMFRMTQLYYFKKLARTQNITKTAEELHISPPSLKATITRLEEELGVKLFDKKGRNIYLNEYGEIFLRHVDDVFDTLENACRKIEEAARKESHSIKIGASALSLWLDAIALFYQKNPDAKISHSVLKMDRLNNPNFYSEFDFIITSNTNFQDDDWESEVLISDDKPVIVVHPEHHLADRKEIRLIEAKDEKFVALSAGYASRKYFNDMCKLAGFEPKISIEGDYTLRTQMMQAKQGIGFSTILGSRAMILQGFKFVNVTGLPNVRTQSIFWKKDRILTQTAADFKDFMVEHYNNIEKEMQKMMKYNFMK